MMEIIGDFEAGINSLQNPSFVSQVFSLSEAANLHQSHNFLKYGALILVFLASFSTIINTIKLLILRFHSKFFPAPNNIQQEEDYSYDSDSDSSCSSVSSEEEEEEDIDEDEGEDEPLVSTSSQNWRSSIDEDFRVKGSDHDWKKRNLRERRNRSFEYLFSSFSELTNGNNVVKLWDNLGFGLRFNSVNESTNQISVFDAICDQNLFSIFGDKSQIPAISVSSSSPAVIVSAETSVHAQLLKVWDTRVGGRLPGILAEWKPKLGKIVGIGSGSGSAKLYVGDDFTGRLTVGDLRKLGSPLATTEQICGVMRAAVL